MEEKHSRRGVASFVMAISVVVFSAALVAAITLMRGRIDQGGAFAVAMIRFYGLVGGIIILLTLGGIGLGIAGVVQRARRRTLAVAGLCILAVVVILQGVLLVSFFREQRLAANREGLFFYSPDQRAVDDYFNLYEFLSQWEGNRRTVPDERLAQYYRGYRRSNTLQGLLFESFLRQTRNPQVRKQVLRLIERSRLDDEFSKSLVRLYSSRESKTVREGKERITSSYQNRYFDEGINLFSHGESRLFGGRLGLLLFDNPWSGIQYTKKGGADPDDLSLIVGGETNALVAMFMRFRNVSFEEFKRTRMERRHNYNAYGNWRVRPLEKRGILERCGADRVFLGVGTGPDTVQGIERGTFTLYLYSDGRREGYEVSYLMNFSPRNNNYAMRYRIWSTLLMQLNFVYLKAD
ncbi:MAG: hypothetical protein JXA20_12415 [Spirochaetes bacterium]|nr:hypothetical protein [Spirochaetota bacterium]